MKKNNKKICFSPVTSKCVWRAGAVVAWRRDNMVNNATKQQGLYTMQDTEDYVEQPVNIVSCWFWPELDFCSELNLESWKSRDPNTCGHFLQWTPKTCIIFHTVGALIYTYLIFYSLMNCAYITFTFVMLFYSDMWYVSHNRLQTGQVTAITHWIHFADIALAGHKDAKNIAWRNI